MGMSLKIIASSSSGNCALLCTDQCKLLIDAGLSARRIDGLLAGAGVALRELDAVIVSHEHSDHICGLRGLARQPGLKVLANPATAQAIQPSLKRQLSWQLFETGSVFRFRDLEITTFAIPHDAYDPVGFVFSTGGTDLFHPRRTLAWVTDLGFVPKLVCERVRSADVLVLESNHDLNLLDESSRPWSLKQRIKSRHGHLSNQAALEFVTSQPGASWERIYLGHLSKECNCPNIVRQLFDNAEHGLVVPQTTTDAPAQPSQQSMAPSPAPPPLAAAPTSSAPPINSAATDSPPKPLYRREVQVIDPANGVMPLLEW